MKMYYRLRSNHGTYVRSSVVSDLDEARKWRDEVSKRYRDKTVQIVRVTENEEVVE